MDLTRGHNENPMYRYVHDMRLICANGRNHPAWYLLVCADVTWPHDPGTVVERICTILMQYDKAEGRDVQNWPAHIVPEDAELVAREFAAFVQKNRGSG